MRWSSELEFPVACLLLVCSTWPLPLQCLLQNRTAADGEAVRLVAGQNDSLLVARQFQREPGSIDGLLFQRLVVRRDCLLYQRSGGLGQFGRAVGTSRGREKSDVPAPHCGFRLTVGCYPSAQGSACRSIGILDDLSTQSAGHISQSRVGNAEVVFARSCHTRLDCSDWRLAGRPPFDGVGRGFQGGPPLL